MAHSGAPVFGPLPGPDSGAGAVGSEALAS